MSRNLKITLAYDGSGFHGWQVQPDLPTVQGTLAECLGRITGENVLPQGSGRTDAGAHALAQVASVRLNSPIPERNLLVAMNDILPSSIRVTGVEIVEDDFHAPHSATAKTYRYRIYRGDICPPFLARYVHHDPYPMDEDAMIRASEFIVGTFDFTSFAASDPERSERMFEARGQQKGAATRSGGSAEPDFGAGPAGIGTQSVEPDDEDATDALTVKQGNVRTVYSSLWARTPKEFSFTIRGNGFLHHMVRNLVGTFLQVGKGSLKAQDVPAILAAKDRSAAGATAPACGLYLVSVEYGMPCARLTQVATRETLISTNPATGEKLGELACATPEEVHAAVQRAKLAQSGWAALPVKERIAVFKRFQRTLCERRDELAKLISREAGKPTVEALNTEVIVVLDSAEFCIRTAHRFLRDQALPHDNLAMKTKRGKLVREPYGVIGIIAPWNYPFSTPAIETLAALVMGNAVVLKPSEFTPLVALELQRLLVTAGLNPDLMQVVIGAGAVGGALLEADIDKVVFTGSVATGKRVAEAAAKRLLPVLLELGSKDPMIVLEDADLDVASSGAVWGAMMNCGQTCLSIERCYVQRSVYDKFLELCCQKIEKLRVGEGLGSEVEVGPMIHGRQLRTVEDHVNDAVARGARLLTGGRRMPELGPNFYAPTLLADVTQDMRIMQEETFGPALPVAAFNTDDEAVRLANDSQFGLAASVWTTNSKRGEAIAARIKAGTVMVNDAISAFGIAEAPHGGFEQSGIGRAHGELGLAEMVLVKYVDVDLLPRMKKVWWYGYSAKFYEQMSGFIDMLFGRGLMARFKGAIGATGALRRRNRV